LIRANDSTRPVEELQVVMQVHRNRCSKAVRLIAESQQIDRPGCRQMYSTLSKT
jgi:hypothetical protein